jgi:hypothetical protein
MPDPGDYEIDRSEPEERPELESEEPPLLLPPRRPPYGLIAAAALALIGLGFGAYWIYLRPQPIPTPAPTTTLAAPPAPTPVPRPEALGLPSLDASDALVRELAAALTSHPLLGAWLGQQDLVRLAVVVVDNVANGESPRAHLRFLEPKKPFAVAQRAARLVIDPASYGRYDFFAEGVASLDTPACAELVRRLLPLAEAAYRELGHPQGGFLAALRKAIDALVAVPALDGEVEVRATRKGNVLVYQYADPKLEALTPPQKHLMKMGPANVRRIQGRLRELAAALDAGSAG